MREILFKARRIDNKEWVVGYLIQTEYFGTIRSWISVIDDKTRLRAVSDYYCDWRAVEVLTETVCQYSGLKDTNQIKIYEKDIVNVWWRDSHKYKAVVEHGNPNGTYGWGWQLRFKEGFPYNKDILLWVDMEESGAYCEVIGSETDNILTKSADRSDYTNVD